MKDPKHLEFNSVKNIRLVGGPLNDGAVLQIQLPPDGRLTFFRLNPEDTDQLERLNYYITAHEGEIIAEYSAG